MSKDPKVVLLEKKTETHTEEFAPKVVSVKPVGSQILYEELTRKEMLGTKLVLSGEGKKETPQGYIIAVGPAVGKDWGFAVGDRVIVVGQYVPVPEMDGRNGRKLGLCEPHAIKAVLVEG